MVSVRWVGWSVVGGSVVGGFNEILQKQSMGSYVAKMFFSLIQPDEGFWLYRCLLQKCVN